MNTIPDPRKLLEQLKTQTAANRYVQLIKASNARLVDRIVRK